MSEGDTRLPLVGRRVLIQGGVVGLGISLLTGTVLGKPGKGGGKDNGKGNDDGDVVHVREGDSIQEAIDEADEGDKILIHSGTYEEGRISVNKDNLTLKGAGQVTITADTDEVNNDAPGDPSDNNKATLTTRGGDGVTLKNLEIERVVNPEEYDYVDAGNFGDQNSKALGVKSSGVTVKNCTVRLTDYQPDDEEQDIEDKQSNAIWVANNFDEEAPAVENVDIVGCDIIGDPTDTDGESDDDFRNGVGIVSLSENGISDIRLIGNTISDAANGVLTGALRDDVENVTLRGNKFENVDEEVQDEENAVDRKGQ